MTQVPLWPTPILPPETSSNPTPERIPQSTAHTKGSGIKQSVSGICHRLNLKSTKGHVSPSSTCTSLSELPSMGPHGQDNGVAPLFRLLLVNQLVRNKVVNMLDAYSLMSLRQSCTQLSQIMNMERFNIDHKLRRFVENPCGLRQAMRETNALIASHFAREFFEGKVRLDTALEIYVSRGREMEKLSDHLADEGHVLSSCLQRSQRTNSQTSEIEYTCTYKRKSETYGETEIQVHQTTAAPLTAILLSAFLNIDLNIISCDKAYSLYPLALRNQLMAPLHRLNSSFGTHLAACRKRGWDVSTLDLGGKSMRPLNRHLLDRQVWRIPLRTSCLPPRKTADVYSALESSHWSISVDDPTNGIYKVHVLNLTHPLLKGKYTITSSIKVSCFPTVDNLTKRLAYMVAALDEADRPPGVWKERVSARAGVLVADTVATSDRVWEGWTPPRGQWKWFDDLLSFDDSA